MDMQTGILDNFIKWSRQVKMIQINANQVAAEYGISLDSFLILNLIKESSDITPGEIVKVMGGAAPKTSRKINILYRKQLIDKTFGSFEDQRKVILNITPEGKRVLKQANEEYVAWYRENRADIISINEDLKNHVG